MQKLFLCSLGLATLLSLPLMAQRPANDPNVIIHQTADPDRLNPLTSTSANAQNIQNLLFSALLDYDPKSLTLRPFLAVSRPKVETAPDGKMSLTYEIRPEAVWDNGAPVLATDFIFTIKAVKNPLVNASATRPYYEFIEDISIDPKNPKRFTIHAPKPYFSAEESSGTFAVLPEYIYDPQQTMRKFSIPQLNKGGEELLKNADLQAFAKSFNDVRYERSSEAVIGSGPYRLQEWKENERIVLVRKANWWGDKVAIDYLRAYPPTITYLTVADPTLALKMLQEQKIDVMSGIRPDNFKDMAGDPNYTKNYNLYTPQQLSYQYIGFNTQNPKLSDKNVRKALSHLVNRQEMIDILFGGDATKTNSPIHPAKPHYNKNLKDLEYNPQKAKELLAAAGWKDSDGDGVLDKEINGKLQQLSLVYKYNSGNFIRKEIGFLLQEEAEAIGVKIEMVALEWNTLLKEIHNRDFEIICMAWSQTPGLDDMKQLWHSSSDSPDGSNYVGFRNPQADQVIDELRATVDEKKQLELYYKIQELIVEDQPYVFLFTPKERLAIHKRFKAETSTLRPSYQVQLFKPQ
jgi:peptide/nickel transport system substrate-binding protein